MPSRGMTREGERQRRMRDVGAADVERPGDILRVGHDQHIGTQLFQLGLDALELVGGAFAGKLDIAQSYFACGGRRAVAPQRVDRVAVDRNQFGASRGADLLQFLRALGGVQPGIVAELGSAGEIAFQPLLRRPVHQMLDGEKLRIDLRRRLHGVAAVYKHGRALGQHDRRPGRSGEAGQPGQALLACGQVFVLLAVGARYDETVEPAALEFAAQAFEMRGRRRALVRIVEGLE